MPLYIYHCETCGRDVEELQRHGDGPPDKAEDCQQGSCVLVKKMTTASFGFKPSDGVGGWSATPDGLALVRKTKGRSKESQ